MTEIITRASTKNDWEIWVPEDNIMHPEILENPIPFDLYDYEDYHGIYQQILAHECGYATI